MAHKVLLVSIRNIRELIFGRMVDPRESLLFIKKKKKKGVAVLAVCFLKGILVGQHKVIRCLKF